MFGLTKTEGEAKSSESKNGGIAKSLGGRRHSAAPQQQRGSGGSLSKSGSASPRSDKWRSLARVVLGNVDEGGEARPDETGDTIRSSEPTRNISKHEMHFS